MRIHIDEPEEEPEGAHLKNVEEARERFGAYATQLGAALGPISKAHPEVRFQCRIGLPQRYGYGHAYGSMAVYVVDFEDKEKWFADFTLRPVRHGYSRDAQRLEVGANRPSRTYGKQRTRRYKLPKVDHALAPKTLACFVKWAEDIATSYLSMRDHSASTGGSRKTFDAWQPAVGTRLSPHDVVDATDHGLYASMDSFGYRHPEHPAVLLLVEFDTQSTGEYRLVLRAGIQKPDSDPPKFSPGLSGRGYRFSDSLQPDRWLLKTVDDLDRLPTVAARFAAVVETARTLVAQLDHMNKREEDQ
jgi:hypothetical protein